MTEIKIHHSLTHTNVVKFQHFFEDSENVYILLEVCHNQTLNDLLKRRKRISDLEMQSYLLQIIDALKYIHSKKVIHRDLKLGNLFLSDKMEIKVGDFGLACKVEYEGERKKTVCGTPNYIAPEILESKNGHSYEVDAWSLGVICYTLLIGKPPFETNDVKATYKRIRAVSYTFPDSIQISDSAKDLISKLLVKQPERRLTNEEIMRHPFMNPNYQIPRLLPVSTMAMPPNPNYIKQLSSENVFSHFEQNDGFRSSQKFFTSNEGFAVNRPSTDTLPPKASTGHDLFHMDKRIEPSPNKFNTHNNFYPNNDLRASLRERKDFGNTGERTSEIKFTSNSPLLMKHLEPEDEVRTLKMSNNYIYNPSQRESSPIIRQSPLKPKYSPNTRTATKSIVEEVFVTDWIDYSNKYGLGKYL